MTEYALAPSRKWTFESGYTSPRVMLEQGLLTAYRIRENGTMRHLELYPLGSTLREAAEWVSDRIDMDGASVQAVARQINVSTPTIRRYLESLELTEEVEAGEWDGLSFDSAGNPVWDEQYTSSEEEAAELAGDIADLLDNPPTVAEMIEATNAGTDVAPRPTRTRRTRQPRPIQDVVASQGLNWPTEEERAAALADVPGSQCEPQGTTAEELTETLAASVAAQAPAARSATLAVCFCGGNGQHAPGAEGCVNRPIPRRTRSH